MPSLWFFILGFVKPIYKPDKKIKEALIDNNALEKNKLMMSR